MKRTYCLMLLMLLAVTADISAGFDIGITRAIKRKVKILDNKVADSRSSTNAQVLPATQPSNLTGSATTTRSILWSWSSVLGASGIRVVSASDANLSNDLAASAVGWTETGLSTNTAYTRRVVAFNAVGNSTSTALTKYTLAAAPTSFALVQVYFSSITVAWAANNNPAGTSYQTLIWTAGGSTTTMSMTSISTAMTGLNQGATYYLAVRAVNGDGIQTALSSIVSSCTRVASAPAQPTGLAGTPANTTSVAWTWNSVAGASGIRVVSVSSANLSNDLAASAVGWTETGLSTNTAY
ncbi:MAG: fibronectin type III domain-containing protein, partial [Elusimicrobiota bacterium]